MNWISNTSPRLGGWVVEAIGPEGEVYVAQFYGPSAECRAKEYAAYKKALSEGLLHQPA